LAESKLTDLQTKLDKFSAVEFKFDQKSIDFAADQLDKLYKGTKEEPQEAGSPSSSGTSSTPSTSESPSPSGTPSTSEATANPYLKYYDPGNEPPETDIGPRPRYESYSDKGNFINKADDPRYTPQTRMPIIPASPREVIAKALDSHRKGRGGEGVDYSPDLVFERVANSYAPVFAGPKDKVETGADRMFGNNEMGSPLHLHLDKQVIEANVRGDQAKQLKRIIELDRLRKGGRS
jgi:hypothetical protein